jgi:hypothetical protein
MRKTVSLFFLLVTISILTAAGFESAMAQVDRGTLWRDAVVTELDADFGGTGFHARWTYHRCSCGDLLVQVEQVAPDGVETGELLMVAGKVLLARGFEHQVADTGALFQAPSLMLQLVYALLNRSQPKGPHAVSGKQKWDEREEVMDVMINTGMATGAFAAPWSVDGSGWKADSGSYRFDLHFQFNISQPGQPVETESINFSGDLDFRQQGFPYSDSTKLEGWRVQYLSSGQGESEPVEKSLTLKDLRKK